MAQQVIDNGESGLNVREAMNAMFSELFSDSDATLRKLRSTLDRSVAKDNRLRNQPWNPCPAWAASTVYSVGRRVLANGNEYACTVAGTSGASAPSGAGLVTDNTAKWQYIGPAVYTAAMDNAPSYSTSSSAPALGKFFRNAACTWASGAGIVVSNDKWFNLYGNTSAALDANGIGNFHTRGGAISFWTDDSQIVIAAQGGIDTADYGSYVVIDDRYLTPTLIPDAVNNAPSYLTINFNTRGPHKVTIWRHMETGTPFKGVYTSTKGTLWADKDPSQQLRLGVVGDSYGLYSLYHGANLDRTIQATLGAYIGSNNVFGDPVGGSGFVNGTPYGDSARVAALISYAPDVVVAWNSVNDNGVSQSALQTGFDVWYTAVRAGLPDAYIFVVGQMFRNASEATIDTYLRPHVEGISDSKLRWLAASGAPEGPWVTGSGNISSAANDGNADIYIAQDNLHPTQRGREYMGFRIYQAIMGAVNAL